MKACFLTRFGPPEISFEWREMPVPEPGRGEVLIKVEAFGLNYADVMARQGWYKGCPPLPCVLGYDVEGKIEAVGADVVDFKKGDRVFALTRFGGYAEYVATVALAVAHLPANATIGDGCAQAVQGVTAYHACIHVQSLMSGERLLVHAAAGGLGVAIIQIAQSKGCEIIAVAGGQEKVKFLQALGVKHIVDHQQTDYLKYVKTHFNGRVDVVFDNIGGSSIKKAKSILSKGGRIISLGAAAVSGKKGRWNLIPLVLGFGWFSPISYLGKSQALIGINMLELADRRPDIVAAAFKGVQSLWADGILRPHVGRIFSKDEIQEAHAFMQNRNSIGKLVVQL